MAMKSVLLGTNGAKDDRQCSLVPAKSPIEPPESPYSIATAISTVKLGNSSSIGTVAVSQPLLKRKIVKQRKERPKILKKGQDAPVTIAIFDGEERDETYENASMEGSPIGPDAAATVIPNDVGAEIIQQLKVTNKVLLRLAEAQEKSNRLQEQMLEVLNKSATIPTPTRTVLTHVSSPQSDSSIPTLISPTKCLAAIDWQKHKAIGQQVKVVAIALAENVYLGKEVMMRSNPILSTTVNGVAHPKFPRLILNEIKHVTKRFVCPNMHAVGYELLWRSAVRSMGSYCKTLRRNVDIQAVDVT